MSPLLTTMKERISPIWKSVKLQFESGRQWLIMRQQPAFWAAGVGIVLLLLIFSGVTAAVAAVAAWIALMRHFGQTEADRQRRVTESFSKAVEQSGFRRKARTITGR
jgi:Flp pilus assembly protein TadB